MKHFDDLSDRLAALLDKKGWTQRDLHQHSGVAASQISDYLNPKKRSYPTLPTLSRLLEALGASREDLFSIPTDVPADSLDEPRVLDTRVDSLEEHLSYIETQIGALRQEFDRRLHAIEHRDKDDTQEHGTRFN